MARRATWFAFPSVGHRGRRILHAGGWSLIAKGTAAANLFVAVPFVLAALGPARFGAWATMVSLVMFSGFLDFGMSNGAMNLVAGAHGRDAKGEVCDILREARTALNRIGLALGLMALVVLPFVPWYRLLGMEASMETACRMAVAVVLATIVVSVPLNLANRAQLAIGRGDRTFRWQAIGQFAALVLTIAIAKSYASLVALTAAAVATPVLASVSNTLLLWRELRRDEKGASLVGTDHRALRWTIAREGLAFFGLQLAAALAFSGDLLLISMLQGSKEAGAYAIVQRMFSVIPLSLSLVWAPLWPIYRQALASKDYGWVKRTLTRSLIGAFVFTGVLGPGLALGFNSLSALWVRSPVLVPGALLGGFAAWSVVEGVGTALATFLNAASILRYQLMTTAVLATTCIIGKALVINIGHVDWVPWVTVMTYLIAVILPATIFLPRLLDSTFHRSY